MATHKPISTEYTRKELDALPNAILADLVLSSALGCGDVVIARILKEASLRLRRLPTGNPGVEK